MSRHNSPFNLLLIAVVIFAFGAFSSPASAATAGIDKGIINGGSADFGSGGHYLGSPTQPYTVTWDYSVSGTSLIKTAHIQGYLYIDKLFGSGTARLKVNYENLSGAIISSQTLQFSGPGFDANNQANQLKVDVSKSAINIARVVLITGFGDTASSIQDTASNAWNEPRVSISGDTLTNGDWTFQAANLPNGGIQIFPSEYFPAAYGSMDALVMGQLTPNNLAFVPRMLFNYLDANGSLIDQDVWDVAEGFSPLSNRNNVANIFKIRVELGNLGFGGLENIVSRTYALGPAVGDAECVPFATNAAINDLATVSLRWTVPGNASWHSLDAVEFRLIDDAGEILHARWEEASNAFFFFDADTGRYVGPDLPGSNARFERPEVAMLLSNTQVIGSGPLGPSVALNLGLRFKPQAAGRTFQVEARAGDKSGSAQGWVPAGTISVLPKH
jgi:hypothetical protein